MKKVAIYQVLSYHSSKISGMTGLLQAYLLGHDPVNSLYTAPNGWAMRKNDLFQGCGSSSFFCWNEEYYTERQENVQEKNVPYITAHSVRGISQHTETNLTQICGRMEKQNDAGHIRNEGGKIS